MPTPVRLASLDASAVTGDGGTSLRIKGGDKIRRFIVNANNPRLVALLAAESIRRRVLPTLKIKMPNRTGALMRSLEIRQNHSNVELWGIFYAPYVRRGGSAARVVIDELMDLIEQHRRGIGNDVINGLRR